jgi:hypothetical protein
MGCNSFDCRSATSATNNESNLFSKKIKKCTRIDAEIQSLREQITDIEDDYNVMRSENISLKVDMEFLEKKHRIEIKSKQEIINRLLSANKLNEEIRVKKEEKNRDDNLMKHR